jgi:glycosyltransferase involved in cell wall biosynthesis
LKLAYIIGTYPALTTTFIDREIRILRCWGVEIQVVSIRQPEGVLPAEQQELQQGVFYLLPVAPGAVLRSHLFFVWHQPGRYFGTLFYLLSRPHRGWPQRAMTLLHFGEGVYAAYLLRDQGCEHLHAHFVDRAATVALVAARLLSLTYSVTAHARDIYVDPVILTEKLTQAAFATTCTAYNQRHLSTLLNDETASKVRCIYHGLNLSGYAPREGAKEKPPLLLAVGQLKEKKGFSHLVSACRLLKEWGYTFQCEIIGEGSLRPALERQIRELGLESIVFLRGALPHQQVIEKYRQATMFVLPAVLSADGDRDGIPNVILEALAMELPVVSTRHSGIPEVIQDGVNGLLVPPEDIPALANALAHLLDHPEEAARLGQEGRRTVAENFDVEQNVRKLLKEFERVVTKP